MNKKKFGKLISDRFEMTIPNKGYYSVLLSESELHILLKCLNFCFEMSFFLKDSNCISRLFEYLETYLKKNECCK